jgi:hypothetical protein
MARGGASSKSFEVAEYKGLTDLEFGTLWALILDEEWQPDVHELEEISVAEDGETWLFRFPGPLVDALAGLESAGSRRSAPHGPIPRS